jgi:DNA repair exonuclease SbcCD ATPase subunit/predicted MPP superfamily phosphohydrolase
MRTIDIGLKSIDKIFHIADVHVRNVKRHTEYEQVFKRLYKYIKKHKTTGSVIYVAGDIVHAKTDMSPELVQTVSDFFANLADIAPTLIITGNHDCNLNNSHRLDALTPIVKALNHPNIHYLKDNGIYWVSNVHFNVMSVFEKPVNYIKASDFEGEYKIALHHGAVNSAQTDMGMTLSNTHVTTELFNGHDLVLLGDIHKPQFLNTEKTIAYAGSLIQQNFGEGLNHGIMVWDLATKQCEFVEIENDYGYYTFDVDNGKILNPATVMPKKPRIRIKVKDTDSATLKTLVSEIRQQYKVQEVTIQKVNPLASVTAGKKISFGNVRDVEWQNTIITDYLTDELALDDKMLDTVRHINRTVFSKLTDSELTRNVVWIPKYFEFSNMFSYGDDNHVDFASLNGSYGLFAPNASGKSTLFDALAFCCFDKCSRTSKAVHVLNNKSSNFTSKFTFELEDKTYVVERNGKKQSNGHVKVDVEFYHIDDTGNITSLNGDQRDSTNKIIQQYLGGYEDFVLTALSLQNNNTGFIDMSQKDRKDLLSQFLDINVFEKQYQIAADDSKDTAALIREYKRTDLGSIIAESEQTITQTSVVYNKLLTEKESTETMKEDINKQIIELSTQLRPIDDNIKHPDQLQASYHAMLIELDTIKQNAVSIKNDIDAQQSIVDSWKSNVSQYDITEIRSNIITEEQTKKQLTDLTTRTELLKQQISHATRMVEKLDNHKWNPNCEFCMANPWLHDTQVEAEKLPQLQEDYDNLLITIADIKVNFPKVSASNLLTGYQTAEQRLHVEEQKLSGLTNKLNGVMLTAQSHKDKITRLAELIKTAEDRISDIESNKQLESEILELQEEMSQLTTELKQIDTRILEYSGKKHAAETAKQNALRDIERLAELEVQYKGYEYYLQAVKRDGVPYQLIARALPQIESEINNILTQIVDFTVILNTDGKNIHGYIVYDNDNYWPLELTSGMEKFIASLAIRTSLINITSLPRPNFLAIDEGFGVLDSDNLNSMYMLFDYLKSQFGFIMCISHIDAMRDVVDKLVEIKKENGYSKINYSYL